MSTKGLFIPLSVVIGDTLDVAFDISIDGDLINPDDITLEGQFVRDDGDSFPESFVFSVDEVDTNKVHARVESDTTEGLAVGEYSYQIRFTHNVDLSDEVDSTGDKTTILYGNVTVLPSPLFSWG